MKDALLRSASALPGSGLLAAAADLFALAAARRVVDATVMPQPGELASMREDAEFYTTGEFAEHPGTFFDQTRQAGAPPDAVGERKPTPPGATRRLAVRFSSDYEVKNPDAAQRFAAHAENRVARADWTLRDGNHPGPVVIAVHGFAGGSPRGDGPTLLTPALFDAGLDICHFTVPLHGKRAPKDSKISGSAFTVADVPVLNEAMGQAVHDIAGLARWLRSKGTPSVGIIGLSLGGYIAALAASIVDELDFAIAMAAPADFGWLAWDFMSHSRHFSSDAGIDEAELSTFFRVHSPLAHPAPTHKPLMLVRGTDDRIVPRRHTDALVDHWDGPCIHAAPGGHLLPLGRECTGEAVAAFVRDHGLA